MWTLSKAGCPSLCRWVSFNQLKAWLKQKCDLHPMTSTSYICNVISKLPFWFYSKLPLDLNHKSFLSFQAAFLPHQILHSPSLQSHMHQFLKKISLSLSLSPSPYMYNILLVLFCFSGEPWLVQAVRATWGKISWLFWNEKSYWIRNNFALPSEILRWYWSMKEKKELLDLRRIAYNKDHVSSSSYPNSG